MDVSSLVFLAPWKIYLPIHKRYYDANRGKSPYVTEPLMPLKTC